MKITDQTRVAALAELRTWLGTRWVHQGRTKGKGCDCIGLAIAAARALDIVTPRMEADLPRGYGRIPHNDSFHRFMLTHLDPIGIEGAKVLDLALIKGSRYATHVAVLGNHLHTGVAAPFTLIHAMIQAKKVAEGRYDPREWSVLSFYRFREPG